MLSPPATRVRVKRFRVLSGRWDMARRQRVSNEGSARPVTPPTRSRNAASSSSSTIGDNSKAARIMDAAPDSRRRTTDRWPVPTHDATDRLSRGRNRKGLVRSRSLPLAHRKWKPDQWQITSGHMPKLHGGRKTCEQNQRRTKV